MIKTKDIKTIKHISDLTEEKLNNLKLVSQETNKDVVSTQGEFTKDILKARSIERLDAIDRDSSDLDRKIGEIGTSVTEELTEITNRTETVISNSEKYKQDIEAFLSVAKGDDFLFFLDDCTRAVGRLDKLTNGSYLCYGKNITSWDIPLPQLTNGVGMFYGTKLERWNIDLPALTSGGDYRLGMFRFCSSLMSFNSNLSKLTNGYGMFELCPSLANFNGNLSKLTNGHDMFKGCTALTSFSELLPDLVDGQWMFMNCLSIVSWNIDLPVLVYGGGMFVGCSSLKSFNSVLPKLESATRMFKGCTSLTSFSCALPALKDGNYMFYNCTSLTSFTAHLPSLTYGNDMFYKCKLNLVSVQNIADTINNLAAQSKTGSITIGMQTSLRYNDNLTEEEQPDATAVKNAIATIVAKGWVVTEQYN